MLHNLCTHTSSSTQCLYMGTDLKVLCYRQVLLQANRAYIERSASTVDLKLLANMCDLCLQPHADH